MPSFYAYYGMFLMLYGAFTGLLCGLRLAIIREEVAMMRSRLYRVNEVARELGVSETFLRRGERQGRIPEAKRDLNGWRVYTDEDVARLKRLLFKLTR
jgi:hypothetical protein